jgi:hypothetical protein
VSEPEQVPLSLDSLIWIMGLLIGTYELSNVTD